MSATAPRSFLVHSLGRQKRLELAAIFKEEGGLQKEAESLFYVNEALKEHILLYVSETQCSLSGFTVRVVTSFVLFGLCYLASLKDGCSQFLLRCGGC